MKNTKKFAAMIAALTLTACSIAPMFSFADSKDYDLALPNGFATSTDASISEVKAYKVFNVTDLGSGSYKVDNWADGVTSTAICTAWAEYLNTGKDADATDRVSFTGDNTAADVAKTLTTTNADAFAKIVAKNVSDTATATATSWSKETKKATFSEPLANGYYVFTCKATGDDNKETYSLGMLCIINGDSTQIGKDGVAKVALPSVIKKVQEDSKSDTKVGDGFTVNGTAPAESSQGYNDIADYSIGEAVPFKIYGTMPSNLADYDTYKYIFTDTLNKEFDAPTEITVKIDNTEIKFTGSNGNWTENIADGGTSQIATGSGLAITQETVTDTNATKLSIAFTDVKKFSGVTANTVITVSYSAVLNSNAVIGTSGQDNAVNLTYSNNPNKQGDGDTGTTPDDKVRVYTYGIDIDKKFFDAGNGDITAEEIMNGKYNDVTFKLYKDVSSDATSAPTGDTNVVKLKNDSGEYVKYIDISGNAELKLTIVDSTGAEMTVNENTNTLSDGTTTYYYDETTKKFYTDESKTTEATGIKTVLKIKGLDAGNYWLDETAAPGGFDKVSQMITITATGTGEESTIFTQNFNGNTDTLTSINNGNGDFYGDYAIQNKQGSTLPSTGGIGTTIFYLGGGAMVAVAGVFLITKKRMGRSEN